MSREDNLEASDVVDRAVDRLRGAPVPDGPPAEAMAAVLAAGADAVKPHTQTTWRRKLKMKRIAQLAAVIAGIAGVAVWMGSGEPGKSAAWADVQEKIRKAQTMTSTLTMRQKGAPPLVMRIMIKEPGLMRQELTQPAEAVNIMDMSRGDMLSLMPKEKKAIRIDLSGLPEAIRREHEKGNYMAETKKLIEESETELGEKQIAGRQVKGYRTSKHGVGMDIWADAKTGDPVQIEMTMFEDAVKAVMTELQFDADLDDDLFSLEVPPGYTLMENTMSLRLAGPEDVVELLRAWARAKDGQFPEMFTPLEWSKDAPGIVKGLSEAEAIRTGQTLGRVMLLMQLHPEAHYAGKGVRLGDKDAAIFWYKPKDAETYKVIYGDLSIRDVAEEDLPETDPAEQPD